MQWNIISKNTFIWYVLHLTEYAFFFFVHAEIYPQTPSQFYHQGCFRTWHNCLVCKFNKLINKHKKGVKTLQKSFFHMLCQNKKSRSRLFPGSTCYHSRNLRHSSIHELGTVSCFFPHNRENWSHSLNGRFLLCTRVLAEITVIVGSIFLLFPLIFFRLYLIKVRIGKLNTVVFFFCRNLSSNNIATLDANIFSSLRHLDYL